MRTLCLNLVISKLALKSEQQFHHALSQGKTIGVLTRIKRFPMIKLDFSSETSNPSFPKNLTQSMERCIIERCFYVPRTQKFSKFLCPKKRSFFRYSKRRNGEIIKSLAIADQLNPMLNLLFRKSSFLTELRISVAVGPSTPRASLLSHRF